MKILIFGATGFIGKALTNYLYAQKHEVAIITRNRLKAKAIFADRIQTFEWDFQDTKALSKIIASHEVLVNLAGENIASQLWTKKQKERIIHSRVQLGNMISNAISESENKPSILIQASAIGFYGYQTKEICTEKSPKGNGFLTQVSEEWEKSTEEVENFGVKRIVVRTGVVLGKDGGILPKFIFPIKYFMGSNFGKGNNWISWIHIRDEIRAIEFLIQNNESSGVYNLVAPNAIRSFQLNKLIGKKLQRPIWLYIPKFILKLILGQMAKELLLSDQRVIPEKLQTEGFIFFYPEIENAIHEFVVL